LLVESTNKLVTRLVDGPTTALGKKKLEDINSDVHPFFIDVSRDYEKVAWSPSRWFKTWGDALGCGLYREPERRPFLICNSFHLSFYNGTLNAE
jgi:hypothetical protein